MNNNDNICNTAILNRFVDNELTVKERARILAHLEICSDCKKRLTEYETISDLYNCNILRVSEQLNSRALELNILDKIQRKQLSWRRYFKRVNGPGRFLVPVAVMAGMLVLVFSFTFSQIPVSYPSAIVSSFSGDVRSVIIMETSETHQTIIWYKENIMSGMEKSMIRVRSRV